MKLKLNIKRGLFSTAAIYTIANFINKLIPFFLLPLLTRYLTTDEYGTVTMFNATASFLIPLAGMSIPTAILRRLVDGENDTNSEYIFNCLLISMAATAAVAFGLYLGDAKLAEITGVPVSLLGFEILYTFATVICQVALSVMQIQGRAKQYALFTNVDTFLNCALSVILILGFNLGLDGRIYGIVVSKCAISIAGLLYLKSNIGLNPNINFGYIKDELTEFGFPLIPTQLKTTVLTYTDKIFLTNLVSVGATGVYTVADQFSSPVSFLVQSFNLAFVPWLFKTLANNNEKDNRLIVKLTYCYFIVVPLASIAWSFISMNVVGWFAGESYAGATDYMVYLCLGYAFSGMHMMIVNYIYYAKKVKLYTLITILIIICNVVLNGILLYFNGPVGAAQATMCANALSFVLTWMLSARVWKMPWNLMKH